MTADKQSILMPRLRFPEFRDGPAWLVPQLVDLYGFKRTYTLSRDQLNYETGTIRNIHYGDIHTKFKSLFQVSTECVPFVNPAASAGGFDDDAFCEEGDIVLADASEDLDGVGKAIEVVSLDGERVVAGTHTILASRRGSVPVVGFGGQLFQSAAVRSGIKKEAQGAKVYGISANRIAAVLLPVPPTEAEQQRIADCLGSLDRLIAAEDRKLEALRQHKQGLVQALFPRIDEDQPTIRFTKYRGNPGWKPRRISELLKKVAVPVVVETDTEYQEIGVRSHGKGVFHKPRVLGSRLGTKHVFRVVEDALVFNIVFAWERAVATTSCTEAGMIASHRFPMYLPKSNRCDVRFMKYAFLTQRGVHVLRVASPGGAGRNRTLGQAELGALTMLVPGRDEQAAIANTIESSDVLIAAQASLCDLIRQHKNGLMQLLFPNPEAIS